MKIKVEVGKLISSGSFSNDSVKACIEFECSPGNYGQLSSRFDKAFEMANQKVRQQIARQKQDNEAVSFNDEEIPF